MGARLRRDASRVLFYVVIPAKAGIHFALSVHQNAKWIPGSAAMKPRQPRNDDEVVVLSGFKARIAHNDHDHASRQQYEVV
jgi:hypothetical protein